MHTKLTLAKLYASAYGHRAAQAVKDNANKVTKTVASHNSKEVTILVAASGALYLASRAAGFKAGYAYAKTPSA